jgi:hypothetical protein
MFDFQYFVYIRVEFIFVQKMCKFVIKFIKLNVNITCSTINLQANKK